jgi:hypothetical protein
MGVFPLRPVSKKGWHTVLVIESPPATELERSASEVDIELGWRKYRSMRSSSGLGKIDLAAEADATGSDRITLVSQEVINWRPHGLSAAVRDSDGDVNLKATLAFQFAPAEPKDLHIGGPILARPGSANTPHVVGLDGDRACKKFKGELSHPLSDGSLEPLLDPLVRPDEEVVSIAELCVRKPGKRWSNAHVERRVRSEASGSIVHRFEPAQLELVESGWAYCHRSVDRIPAEELAVGSYRFEIEVSTGSGVHRETGTRFAVIGAGESSDSLDLDLLTRRLTRVRSMDSCLQVGPDWVPPFEFSRGSSAYTYPDYTEPSGCVGAYSDNCSYPGSYTPCYAASGCW